MKQWYLWHVVEKWIEKMWSFYLLACKILHQINMRFDEGPLSPEQSLLLSLPLLLHFLPGHYQTSVVWIGVTNRTWRVNHFSLFFSPRRCFHQSSTCEDLRAGPSECRLHAHQADDGTCWLCTTTTPASLPIPVYVLLLHVPLCWHTHQMSYRITS